MKKILQEKRSLWKKITSWILVMAILFTSADFSVFTVGAEEPVDFSSEANEATEEPATAAEPATEEDMAETSQQNLTETSTEVFSDSADFSDSGENLTEEIPQEETEELFTDEDIFSDGSASQNGSEDFSSEEKTQEEQTEKIDFNLKVFEDANKNGAWDEGENGITGLEAEASLHGTEDKTAAQSVEPGIYSLNGLNKGIYTIRLLAAPEIISPYNLAESVNLSPDKEKIQFPDVDDTWVLSWTEIDLSQTKELLLGLQKDDLVAIEEEIGDAEDVELFQDGERGTFLAAPGMYSNPHKFVADPLLYYGGHMVDVDYYDKPDGGSHRYFKNYTWIRRTDQNVDTRDAVYCVEPFVSYIDKGNYYPASLISKFGQKKAENIILCAYYGADYSWPEIGSDGSGYGSSYKSLYFMAAQSLIWEMVGAYKIKWYSVENGVHFNKDKIIDLEPYKAKIRNKVDNHFKKPEFPPNWTINHDHEHPEHVYQVWDKNGALSSGTNEDWAVNKPAGVKEAWIDKEKCELRFTLEPGTAVDGRQITFVLTKKYQPNAAYHTMFVASPDRCQSLVMGGKPSSITYDWTVTINGSGTAELTKIDDRGTPVSGVSFKWGTDKNNLNHITEKTNEQGKVMIRTNAGRIYVQEYEVPPHLVKDETIKSVVIRSGQTAKLNFPNDRVTKKVTLKKINSLTQEPVAGAKFQYWSEERPLQKYTGITNSKGEFSSFVKFPVGSQVTMKEVMAAPGYELPSQDEIQKTIEISLDESKNVFSFENAPREIPLRIKKLKFRNNQPVTEGVWFRVRTDTGEEGRYKTGPDGILEVGPYPHGTTVYYREIEAPSGFKVDPKEYSVVIDARGDVQAQTVTMLNEEGPIKISVKKKGDDGRPLAGIRFRLEKKIGDIWYPAASNLVTDKNGVLNVGTFERSWLAEERLRLVEETTIPGYDILEEPYVFDSSIADCEKDSIEVTVINKKIPTWVEIYKVDKTEQPIKYLSGAVFEITDSSGKVVETLTTNRAGSAYTTNLLADTQYYIEEIVAPYGYKKIEGRQPLKLDKTNSYKYYSEVPNEPYYGKIVVNKKNQKGQPIPEIEFSIYKGYKLIQVLKTDKNGYAESKLLPTSDTYRIVETYVPSQYINCGLDYEFHFMEIEDGTEVQKDNWTMTFKKDTLTATFDVTNEELFGTVTIKKVDSEDPSIKVQGAEFTLKNRYTEENFGTQTTDKNGICMFTGIPLVNSAIDENRGYYYIEETSPGKNHILPENTKKYFSLTVPRKEMEIGFLNPPIKGSVEIAKVDSENPEIKLQGAEFAIYTAEDGAEGDFSNPVQRATTGADGIALFKDLRYGDYVIKETNAPENYYNDLEHGGGENYDPEVQGYRVTISEHGKKILLPISNPKIKIRVKVYKTGAGKYKLPGVKFNVYAKDGSFLEEIITDNNGEAISNPIDADKIIGGYIQETQTVPGYLLDQTKHEITVDWINEKELTCTFSISNNIYSSQLKLQKVNEDGKPVQASFQVTGMAYHERGSATLGSYAFETDKITGIYELTNIISDLLNQAALYKPYNAVIEIQETKTEPQYEKPNGKLFTLNYNFTQGGVTGPDVYTAPGTSYDQNTMTLTVVNKKIPIKLTIIKADSNVTNPTYLKGAVFEITPIDSSGKKGEPVRLTTTGTSQGDMVLLPYAEEYLIEEIEAPPGYWPLDKSEKIKLSQFDYDSKTQEYSYTPNPFYNIKQPHIVIKKVGKDGTSKKPLSAVFRITEIINEEGKNQTMTVSTKKTDGTAIIDFTEWENFMKPSGVSGMLKIEEISVEDADYKILKDPVYLGWSKGNTSNYSFTTNPPDYQNPDGVTFEEDTNSIIITVPNEKKNYKYAMKKQGDLEDSNQLSAVVTVHVNEMDYEERITSTSLTDVSEIFSGLTDTKGYKITIKETYASPRYGLAPAMDFMYYPENKGLDKFQNITGPVSFEFNKDNSEQIVIKITNTRARMRLYLKKVNEKGHLLPGARFRVTTESPNYTVQYETTGDPAGEYIEFPYAEKIVLTEEQAPTGYQIGADSSWVLNANDFTPVEGSNQSLYECRIYQNNPIKNTTIYNLEIKKVDENGNPANATFKVVNTANNMTWEIVTKDGVADLNPIVKSILKDFPYYRTVQLEVTEIATDEGLLLYTGRLATINVYASMISGSDAYNPYFDLIVASDGVTKDEASSNKSLVIQVKNKPLPVNLTLIKEDKNNPDTYLANAVFEITCHGGKSDGEKITVTTTNTAQGQTVTLPWAESYSVREIKAPKGYILDPTVYDYTIQQFEDQKEGAVLVAKNMKVTYTNTPIKGKIQITKIDADDSHTLDGAEFDIYEGPLKEGHGYENVNEGDYQKVSSITIGSGGIGESDELPYGDYLLKETKAPSGYQITKEIYPVKISREAETVYVQIGDPLVTGADGTISVELPYGNYYFKEVSFPSGYAPAKGNKYEVTLDAANISVEKEILNTKTKYALRLFKRDGNTGEYLAGAEFGLFNEGESPKAGNTPIQTFTTNANGSAVVFLERPGSYDIYELKPPAGYQKNEQKYSVTVTDQEPTMEIVADNTKQILNIEIHKTDETGNKSLLGAVFEIRNAKTGALVATTGATGEDGRVSVEVPAGDFEYTVTEIQAPEGYVLDSTPRPVMINTENQGGQIIYTAETVEITNRQVNGNIKLIKKDEKTKNPLEGAVFGIFDSTGDQVGILTTNSQGEAMSENLQPGTYTLKELTPPPGYELSKETYELELTKGQTLIEKEVVNTPKTGGFTVKKVDPQNPDKKLEGAVFAVYSSYEDTDSKQNNVAEVTTGGTGIAEFTDLPYGIYYVRETKAPEGYKLSDRIYTVTVDENSAETVTLEVENYKEPEDGIFRVRKKDADTGAALAGAVFTVMGGPNGTYNKEYTTADDGTFTTDPLEPGTYTVTETKAPKGYRISDPASQTVEVKAGDGVNSVVKEYDFFNKKIQFQIHIVKTDDSQSPKRLPGAEFKLYQLNDQGERIEPALETLITNINGEAVSRMLSPGTYEIEEVTPPAGYKLANPSSKKVTIAEDAEPAAEFSYTFKNSPETGALKIIKVGLAEGETPENNKGTLLSGAFFEAVNVDTGISYTAKSNQEGIAEFTELPFGIYHVRETTVPEGYEDGSPYEETVVISRETTEEDPVVLTRTAYNYKIYGAVMLTKKDSETGVLVGGATYGIYKKLLDNGDVDPNSHMDGYDLVTIDTEAYITSNPLELGKYYLKEISPPAGYKKNPQIYPVEIKEEAPIVSIEAEDEAYKGKVTIHKKDEAEKSLEGAVFALYKAGDYDNSPSDGADIPAFYATTDIHGHAEFENLTLNEEYVLVEFKAPDGYEGDPTPQRFTPTTEKMDFTYTFINKEKTELLIHKVSDNGSPVYDVAFTVYSYGADNMPETPDDEEMAVFSPEIMGNGVARLDISELKPGWYYVKETQEPSAGFEISQEIIPFEITEEKRDYEFTFVNYRSKGEIAIQKQDETGNPLPGAEFELWIPGEGWIPGSDKNDISFFQKFNMNDKGYGIIKDIPAGEYVLRETKAPEGYKPMEDRLIILYLDGKKGVKDGRVYYSYHYDAVNRPITGWISIQKKAVLDGLSIEDMDLSNAEFTITNEKGEVVDTLITGQDGTAVSKELPQGTYTIQETKAPEGTVLNGETKTITIDGKDEDDIYTYTHKNPVAKGQIQIKKVDGDDPNITLKGAEFDILKEGSLEEADHLIIPESGIGISKELPYGRYIIRETKSPDSYGLQIRDIHCIIRENNKTVELTVENFKTPEDAQVFVVKYDKDNPKRYLKGAEFELYKDEALTDKVEGKFVTDEKGKIALKNELGLTKGKTYYLKEIKAPEGYVVDETVHSFTLDPVTEQTIALYIPNEKEKGYIQFKKTGEMLTKLEDNSTEYPNLKKPVWEQKTLEDAEIGIYAVEPVELDGKTYDKGEVIQRLRSGETSLPLPLGKYQYKELSAPKGYILDDKFHDVVVSKDHVEDANPAIASMENTHASVSLELVKIFQDGNTKDKLDKVKFGVFAASTITSNEVQIPEGTLLGIIQVDEKGHSIPNSLKLPEGSYYIMEIETAEGYVLDGHKYLFKTEYKNKDQKIVISTAENPIVNEPVYGTIRLEKTGDMFTGVQRLVNQQGKYQVNKPVYSKGELKGAEVQIKATTEITIGDKIYQRGQVVDTLISGEKDESIKLPLGTYTLVETKAPEGYVLDTKEHSVTIEENTTPNQPSVAIYKLENKKAIPKIQLYKSFFGKTDAEAKGLYEKVLFGVYAKEDIRGASSDAVLRKDELVGLIRMQEDGTGTFADNTCLPFGSYYIKELETAEGYQVSDKEYTFTVNAETMGSSADPEGTSETGEKPVYREIPIEGISKDNPVINSPEDAKVPFAFRKTEENGTPLAGAVFRLYTCTNEEEGHQHSTDAANADTGCWTEVKGVSPKTSGADGIVDFGILPDGIYQLKETEAPDGYVLPAGQWRFTVDSTVTSGEHIIFISTDGAKPPAFQKVQGQTYQYQVSNRKAMPMPFTGGAGLPAYLGGGGAMLALSELIRRRRRKKTEK